MQDTNKIVNVEVTVVHMGVMIRIPINKVRIPRAANLPTLLCLHILRRQTICIRISRLWTMIGPFRIEITAVLLLCPQQMVGKIWTSIWAGFKQPKATIRTKMAEKGSFPKKAKMQSICNRINIWEPMIKITRYWAIICTRKDKCRREKVRFKTWEPKNNWLFAKITPKIP